MISTLGYFVVTLFILILVHEFGHFIVARGCGVTVERFSFGFGTVLWSWQDKKGTEYAWSLWPLGGYVKLLDDSQGPVPVAQQSRALHHQSSIVQIAIILAGPLFNFLFAFVVLGIVAVIGVTSLAPMIDEVIPHSIAAQAGLGEKQEIIELDHHAVNSWHQVQEVLLPLLSAKRTVVVTMKSLRDGQITQRSLALSQVPLDPQHATLLERMGVVPMFPKSTPVVETVIEDSPGQHAGLQPEDEILSIDHQLMTDSLKVVAYIKARPAATIVLEVRRHGHTQQLIAHLPVSTGYLGIGLRSPSIPADWIRVNQVGPIQAVKLAFKQTLNLTAMTFGFLCEMLTGQLSLEHLSGPVGIAKAANASAQAGWVTYLTFLALLSISLGVLNVLPIPMLDGGHLLYRMLEIVMRRPLSLGFKSKSSFVGILFIVALSMVALKNDLRY